MSRFSCNRSVHHRRCRSNGGGNQPENLLKTVQKYHNAYHLLFCNWEPPRIAQELNRWIPPDWEVIARKRDDYANPT